MNQLVSIIIPTYQRQITLHKLLEIISKQTYAFFECIIVDDEVENIPSLEINNLISNDIRFKYVNRPQECNKGASSCRNIGFLISKGDFICFIDDDDIISENKIELQVNSLLKSGADISTCGWEYFENSTNVKIECKPHFRSYFTPTDLLIDYGLYHTFNPPHVFLIKRELINRAGLWNEFLKNNDDGEFFVRQLISANFVQFVENTHVLYRKPGNNNLSKLQSALKAEHLIISIVLIEYYLKLIDLEKFKPYLKHNKEHAFYKIKQAGYDHLLKKYDWFFKGVQITVLDRFKRFFNKRIK